LRNWFLAALTLESLPDSMPGVKSLLLVCLAALFVISCTTLSNRRDLYQPTEDAGPYNTLNKKNPNPASGNPAQPEALLPASK
jgi:hypothetical protein